MTNKLTNLSEADFKDLEFFSNLRPISICEGMISNQIIWSDYLNTKYYKNENYIFYVMSKNNEFFSMMPLCSTENISSAFKNMENFFNNSLNSKLKIFSLDENTLIELKKEPNFENNYIIEENRDYFDYIYDAEKLRTLSGKKYHKKKNHLNFFLKEYSQNSIYKPLTDKNKPEIMELLNLWSENKEEDSENRLYFEKIGISKILENYSNLNVKIGGIYINDKLEAFSIGSFNYALNCAVIHIEKANPHIRGLYNFINQQFLLNAFPDAITVNREDDLGIEGLRHAKLSYNPIDFAKKYTITQK